jgi:hypothetical protein
MHLPARRARRGRTRCRPDAEDIGSAGDVTVVDGRGGSIVAYAPKRTGMTVRHERNLYMGRARRLLRREALIREYCKDTWQVSPVHVTLDARD